MSTARDIWSEKCILPLESQGNIRTKYCTLNLETVVPVEAQEKLRKDAPFHNDILSSLMEPRPRARRKRFCPECLKAAYHSDLHDNLVFRHCFIHEGQLLKAIGPTERPGQEHYRNAMKDSIVRNDLTILRGGSDVEKAIYAFDGKSPTVDAIDIFDYMNYDHRYADYPRSLEEVLLALAKGKVPTVETIVLTEDDLMACFQEKVCPLLLATREKNPFLDIKAAKDPDVYLSVVFKRRKKNEITEYLCALQTMERVGKAAFVRGCDLFAGVGDVTEADYESIAAAMTVACILDESYPSIFLNRKRYRRVRVDLQNNCPIAPKNLRYTTVLADDFVKEMDYEKRLAFDFIISEIACDEMFHRILGKLQKGTFRPSKNMDEKCPEGFVNELPVLLLTKQGSTVTIYKCD